MGRLEQIGIEKINVYPTQLSLDLSLLATKRNYDINYLHRELMVYERGVNPVWEDSVTMAVNAASTMLTKEDIASIGLLIVGTETSVDQEKSISSWVHRFLQLPSNCCHFELKSACYSGTASLKMAYSWINTIAKPYQKALVITSDQSLHALNKPWEYVGGAGSVALLISRQPDFMILEKEKHGIYSQEVSDVIRPLPWIETGNSENSLFSYMEALNGAYDDYLNNIGSISFEEFFDYNIYHVPFAGISYRAHKQLLQYEKICNKQQLQESFDKKTRPSILYPQKIGATYGSSVFVALLSLIDNAPGIKKDDRIGIFSYGSGSCAEFYSGLVGKKAKQIAAELNLKQKLENRASITVEQYEILENLRFSACQKPNFIPDIEILGNIFAEYYQEKQLLVYKGSKEYYRHYELS